MRTCHINITYIITSKTFTSLSASGTTVFVSFLNIYNVSRYFMTPVEKDSLYNNHFYAPHLTDVLRHTLQHILHFTHTSPTYAQTSFQNSLLKNDLPTNVLFYMHIVFLSHISLIPSSFNLSLACLILHFQTVSFTAHTIIQTHALAHFFTLGSKKISASTLTHFFCYIGILSRMAFHPKSLITTSIKLILKNFF